MDEDILRDAKKITLKNMLKGNYFRIASDVIVDEDKLGACWLRQVRLSGMTVGRKLINECDTINE